MIFGRHDEDSVFCARHCNVKETPFLRILNGSVVFDDIFHHGIVVYLGGKAVNFISCIDDNDIIIPQAL